VQVGGQQVPIYDATPRKRHPNGRVYRLFTARYRQGEGKKPLRLSSSNLETLRAKLKKLDEEAQLMCLRGKPLYDYQLAKTEAEAWGKGLHEAVMFGKRIEERAAKAYSTTDKMFEFYERHHNVAKYATPAPEVAQLYLAALR
jgi:hypothetical protein